jgi:hypothetical protein
MNGPSCKLKAAANAGWWTVGLAYGLLLLQYFFYLYAVSARPDWLITLWGGVASGVAWSEMLHIWLLAMVVFKFLTFMLLLASFWLTLWTRNLSHHGPGGN